MRKIIIGDYQFNMKSDWVDLTLSDFVALCRIEMPEKLLNLYKFSEDKEKWGEVFDTITYEDNQKTFPEYFGRVIGLLSDIPEGIIELIDTEQRTELFNQHLIHFALSSVTDYPLIISDGKTEPYQPEDFKSIEFKGEVYQFPKSLKINGLDTPMSNETIISFTEASGVMTAWNKLAEGGSEYAALIPAIYLRKEGEDYNELMVMQRKELFKDLTMDVVWSLFFYTIQLAMQSLSATLSSLTASEPIKNKRLQIEVE